MNPGASSRLLRVRPAAAALLLIAGVGGAIGLGQRAHPTQPAAASATVEPPTTSDTKPGALAGLHNVVAYYKSFWSGSVPEGDEGFATLAAMGVKTIISVDGAEPDVARARAHGIRYIHLPIGYNGFDEQRKLELTRATRDALKEGPTYIHCHHGKHRSAGAAGAVIATLGWATPQAMVERMKVSGTAPDYQGLYACTANAEAKPAAAIDAVPADFPEISRPTGFVKSMVEIDEINEHLKAVEAAAWNPPNDHPDLVPAAEAGRMADLLRVLIDGDRAKSKPVDFSAMLKSNSDQAQRLEDMLLAGQKDPKKLSAQFKLVAASCKDCHVKHRD